MLYLDSTYSLKLKRYSMLGQFTWKVIHWKKIWRKIGFRTANIELKKWLLFSGTYSLNCVIWKNIFFGVGTYREDISLFEAHLLNFDKNIYGKEVEIIVLDKIRDNRKFSSLIEIKKQIEKDVAWAKKQQHIWITFWTFDIVHKWHIHYLKESKKYCKKLITIVARDINVEKIKWVPPLKNETQRKKSVENLKIADKVILWDKIDPLKWIHKLKPNVLCIWYDQIGFLSLLEKKMGIYTPEIIRISWYKEGIYKSSLLKSKKLAKNI